MPVEEVDSEREVVLEEIAMYEDEPQDRVHDVLARAVHGDHPHLLTFGRFSERVNWIIKTPLTLYHRYGTIPHPTPIFHPEAHLVSSRHGFRVILLTIGFVLGVAYPAAADYTVIFKYTLIGGDTLTRANYYTNRRTRVTAPWKCSRRIPRTGDGQDSKRPIIVSISPSSTPRTKVDFQ